MAEGSISDIVSIARIDAFSMIGADAVGGSGKIFFCFKKLFYATVR